MWLRWEGATLKFLGWLPSSITISALIFPGTAPSIGGVLITTGQETPHLSLASVDAQPIERTAFLFSFLFFFQRQPTNSMGSELKKTTRSCMDTPMNMYSSKGHVKRLTGASFLADIQRMTYAQVHRYLEHASMFLLTLYIGPSQCVAKSVIIEAWTFGYVAIIDSLTWHSILLMELMDIQHRILLIELMDIQHWQTG